MKYVPKGSLLEFLQNRAGEAHSLHVPGHKLNMDNLPDGLPWNIDVTEVPPFDNLHNPEGVLLDCQKFAAEYWNCNKSFYLVGGSTSGILAGIRACVKNGDKILVARNCHKSVYHAIELCSLETVFIDPPLVESYGFYGSVFSEAVEMALRQHDNIRLVVITSPTYEGVLSDVSMISKLLNQRNIPIFVDAAHGAHLDMPSEFRVEERASTPPPSGLTSENPPPTQRLEVGVLPSAHADQSDFFPPGALKSGADLVVHSLHKMLPSLTQTAMLQLNSDRISYKSIQHQLSIFQSSSPSYPLMASIDYCCRILSESGNRLSSLHAEQLKTFQAETNELIHFHIVDPSKESDVYAFDPAKIIIGITGDSFDGFQLEQLLQTRYHIKTELATHNYLLAVSSLYNEENTYRALAEALREIDREIVSKQNNEEKKIVQSIPSCGVQAVCIGDAMQTDGEWVAIPDAADRISREYVWQYPPGAPLLVPGQIISSHFIDWLCHPDMNQRIHSTEGKLPEKIFVLPNPNSSYGL